MPSPSALGWASVQHHLSCPRRIPFLEKLQPGCPLPKRFYFVRCPSFSWPLRPVPHSTHCQVVLPSCLSFPTCNAQGSVTPGAAPTQALGWGQLCLMASLGAGHIWAAKTTLSRDNSLGLSLCHPCCTHWVPLLVLLPRRDLTLPIWSRPLCCCQGTPSGTLSGTTPHWLSQLVTVRGGGDDIPAPAKTNTAPSKHAGLGKPVPQPSITEPGALQPTTAWPGNGAGKNQWGLCGGFSATNPPLGAAS